MTPVSTGMRPVNSELRAGEQTGLVLCDSRNVTPRNVLAYNGNEYSPPVSRIQFPPIGCSLIPLRGDTPRNRNPRSEPNPPA